MTDHRPTFDSVFMDIAEVMSRRATCRRQVGCVVTINNRIIATGYNGAPPGMPHCTDVGCDFYWSTDVAPSKINVLAGNDESIYGDLVEFPDELTPHCRRAIHAEQNAIAHAARNGISLAGATYYTYPFAPCPACELLMLAAGVHRVVTLGNDSTSAGKMAILLSQGIKIVRLKPNIDPHEALKAMYR